MNYKSFDEENIFLNDSNDLKKVSFKKIKWIKSSIEINPKKSLYLAILSIILFGALSYLNFNSNFVEKQVPKSDEKWIRYSTNDREVIQIGGLGNPIDEVKFIDGRYYYQPIKFLFYLIEFFLLIFLVLYFIYAGKYNYYNSAYKKDTHFIELGIIMNTNQTGKLIFVVGNEMETTDILYKIRNQHMKALLSS